MPSSRVVLKSWRVDSREVHLIQSAERSEAHDTLGDWMREHPDKNLNDVRAEFGERFTYGQLRMVQAWVRREE